MPKGVIQASPKTLLKSLAKHAKSEKIRLRAIELILMLEGKLSSASEASAGKSQKRSASSAVNDLQKLASAANEWPANR